MAENSPHIVLPTAPISTPTQSQTPRKSVARSKRYRAGREFGKPAHNKRNVGTGERAVSLAAGSILTLAGLSRRDVTGLLIASLGGALAVRGATGHCAIYQAAGIDTTGGSGERLKSEQGVNVVSSFLINKSPDQLYSYWRKLDNLPQFMAHLESVTRIDDRRSHWVAKAPGIYGGRVEWDAEVTADEPNSRIAWQSLPGADVQHRGSITFKKALGDRGTNVRVEMRYQPPAGQVGRWLAKLFGEEPEQQIRDDLRRFKRLIETGEIPTIAGQTRGTCLRHAKDSAG